MKNERAVAQKQLDILTTLLREGAGSIHNQLEKDGVAENRDQNQPVNEADSGH